MEGEMAAGETGLRDASRFCNHLLPPGETGHFGRTGALVDTDRSFLIDSEFRLPSEVEIEQFNPYDVSKPPAYAEYMQMHKSLTDERGVAGLLSVYEGLKDAAIPRHLNVAGWALAEAALVSQNEQVEWRLPLLDKAVETWRRALQAQEYVDNMVPAEIVECDDQGRLKLNIAVSPLLAGIIKGDVTRSVCEKVFVNCLNIAEQNAISLDLALKDGNMQAVWSLTGFAYELNALLARNCTFSNTWFAIPAMARCDSGHYYRNQTHDLLVIRQRHGAILHGTPVEIKGRPGRRDRERYDALLVRGKMHLSVNGKFTPEHTLKAIGAVYRGDATDEEKEIARNAMVTFAGMLSDYYAGKILAPVAMQGSTFFHDKSLVHAHYPGLSVSAA